MENMLTLIGKYETKDERYYLYKCKCGNIKSIIKYNVNIGKTKSCGCYRLHMLNNGLVHKKYGFSHTRIDNIYKSMVNRCTNHKSNNYSRYGGRGITVCSKWLDDKIEFFKWATDNGYSDNLTLDRIDVNGNYEPSNCRWATYKQQANNTRNNKIITIGDVSHTQSEWCDIYGIGQKTFCSRLRRGWGIEKALTEPLRKGVV